MRKQQQMEIKIVENRFTRHEKKNKIKPDKKKTGKMNLIFQDLNGGLQWKSKMINKKFSKKIWVLSAGIIVILAIVLFAGIKNGFFLRKGDKILYAAYHTIKDQPETADVSKDEDYTVSMDGQWKEQKIQAEYASASDQKQLKGTIDLDKLPDLEFVMTLDEKELKTQLLSLSSKVFTYDYKNGGKSGYLAKKIGSEKLERFDTILEELYGWK